MTHSRPRSFCGRSSNPETWSSSKRPGALASIASSPPSPRIRRTRSIQRPALSTRRRGNRSMLYYLLYPLREYVSAFNVFRYITFRTAYAALTALLICFILGPWLIKMMTRIKLGQYIREEGPQSHHQKAGTPTMGGILINLAILIPTLLWADIMNPYIWIILFVTFAYGAIGFVDDYRKLVKRQNLGLTAKEKFSLQFAVALIAGLAIAYLPQIHNAFSTTLTFPFFKNFVLNLGFLYIPFVMIVLVGCSNAVNLTDGLDGLAIGTTLVAGVTYTILTYAAGHYKVAEYLRIA